MSYKLGRAPARHTLRTMKSAIVMHQALAALGSPPTVSDDYTIAVTKAVGSDWNMYMNGPDPAMPSGVPSNGIGCCVPADTAHTIMLRSANAGKIIVPTNQDVLSNYETVGNYVVGQESTDNGCDETTECQWNESTGMVGQKSVGTGMVDPSNLNHIRWGIQLFGSVRLGITVTDAMMQAFDAGEPWVDFSGSVLGGHDIPAVYFDADGILVVTWAKLQRVSWSLVANSSWLEEAHVELFPDFLAATGNSPAGFNLPQLTADLPQVAP